MHSSYSFNDSRTCPHDCMNALVFQKWWSIVPAPKRSLVLPCMWLSCLRRYRNVDGDMVVADSVVLNRNLVGCTNKFSGMPMGQTEFSWVPNKAKRAVCRQCLPNQGLHMYTAEHFSSGLTWFLLHVFTNQLDRCLLCWPQTTWDATAFVSFVVILSLLCSRMRTL